MEKLKKIVFASIITAVISMNSTGFLTLAENEKNTFYNTLVEFYNNGSYIKDTHIYINETGVEELKQHFHVETILDRTTYYEKDALWMSRSTKNSYSYYGTSYQDEIPNGITYGVTVEPLVKPNNEQIVLSGENQNSMEEFYVTLKDIIEYEYIWVFDNGVYTTTDSTMLKYFLDFTAPCLYESIFDSNILTYEQATIEVKNNGDLSLKLWVSSTNYGYIIDGEHSVVGNKVVLSEAIIQTKHTFVEKEIIKDATNRSDGLIINKCSECGYEKEFIIPTIQGKLVESYPGMSNADVIYHNGNIYTYGGSPDGINRTNAIYCYNINTNKLYELSVKLNGTSTSHRAILHDDKVYIFGGLTKGSRYNTIQVHDLINQTIKVEDIKLPFGINCFQIGKYKNDVYFVGGTSDIGNLSSIYKVNLATFDVSLLPVNLPTVVFKGGWCQVNNYLYVIGGTMGPRLNTIYRFDMKNQVVETMDATLPVTLSQSRAVYDGYSTIYIYGGTIEGNLLQNSIYTYNIDHDRVERLSYDLPYDLANTCVVRYNKATYILGGNNDITNIILKHKDNQIENIFIKE